VLRVVLLPVQRFALFRDALAQPHHARHGRILIQSRIDVLGDEIAQLFRAVEVRKALGQIDRVVLGRQPRHDREDGRADVRELGTETAGILRHRGILAATSDVPSSMSHEPGPDLEAHS
jgi:hypothetical protein